MAWIDETWQSVPNNKCEQSVNGASDNSEYLDKTYSITNANDCSENSLPSDSNNILTTHQKLSTEVSPKSKSKTKLPQLEGSVPLTIYHDQSNKKTILNKHTKNTFTVFHQNICGLLNKTEELLNSLTKTPHKLFV